MGLWSEKINKSKQESNSSVQPSSTRSEEKVTNIVYSKREIDWEERHFQICLALLSRTDLRSYHSNTVSTVDPKLPMIIKTADKMVELLKERAEIHNATSVNTTQQESTAETQPSKKKERGQWSGTLKRQKIWKALQDMGYTKGSDIPYFHFNECCEELNIDVETIDIEKFAEHYDVNIG